MAIARKDEARALDADERVLVEKSYHPVVQDLADAELADLSRLVRERRDRAQRLAAQRAREIRGKGVPRGATPSTGDAGSKVKVQVLAMAVRRLNAETERRRGMAATAAQMASARKALALKQAQAHSAPGMDNSRASWREQRLRAAQTGARPTSADLMRPMERGRQRKAAAVAQARRDGP
jgi:hypothetical protein